MKPIYVLNGPNLNRLGKREPEIYGGATLADVERYCREAAGSHPVEFRQSNSEAEIIGWIHEAIDSAAGIVINPAALSFTSPSLVEALRAFSGPKIEVHITNVHARDSIYHNSQVSKVVTAVIAGLGFDGYGYALDAVRRHLSSAPANR